MFAPIVVLITLCALSKATTLHRPLGTYYPSRLDFGRFNIFTKPSPAIVSVENFRGLHIANGVLVSNNVVLTSAHSVNGVQENLQVRIGSKTLGFGGQVVKVSKNCPIAGYDFPTKKNDITVLRLDSSVSGVVPANLPNESSDRDEGTAQGWGFNTQGVLEAVSVKRISDDSCKSFYGNAIIDGMECFEYRGLDLSCLDIAQGSAILHGNTLLSINAAVGTCSLRGPPGVFTRVPVASIQDEIENCV